MIKVKNAWINLVFLLVTLTINTLGAVGIINGYSQKQISDMYVTLITPGPSTFSIWGVIYSLLLISMVVMIAKKIDPYYEQSFRPGIWWQIKPCENGYIESYTATVFASLCAPDHIRPEKAIWPAV